MATRLILRKKFSSTLIYLEIAIIMLALSVWCYRRYNMEWVIMLIIFLIGVGLLSFVFKRYRFFRYLITILVSVFWGVLAYILLTMFKVSQTSCWIALIFSFGLSILVHKNQFFESKYGRIY